MTHPSKNVYLTAVGLGAITGMRTMSGPTRLACASDTKIKRALMTLATLEIAGDKLPMTPNRIVPMQLAGRVVSGALSAGLAYPKGGKDQKHYNRWALAMIGGVTAAAMTYLSFYARKKLGKKSGIRDAWLGVAEDALVLAVGSTLFEKNPPNLRN